MQNFERINIQHDKFIAIKINLSRATLKETSEFRDYLDDLFKDTNKNIIIDLTACEYLDSSFLGALVSLLKRLALMNRSLNIVFDRNKDTHNPEIFSITKMDKIFKIFNTLEEAFTSHL